MKKLFAAYILGVITCLIVCIVIYLYSNTEINPSGLTEQKTEVERKIDTLGIKDWPLDKQKVYIDSVLRQHKIERMK